MLQKCFRYDLIMLSAPSVHVIWAVTHPSTNRAQRCLTSVIKWYDLGMTNVARRRSVRGDSKPIIYVIYNSSHLKCLPCPPPFELELVSQSKPEPKVLVVFNSSVPVSVSVPVPVPLTSR
jgi:hypothetical protein